MTARLLPHFYRLHDNGWVSMVSERAADEFTATVMRDGEGGPTRTAADLVSAQRLADTAVPLRHECSSRCTAWFEIANLSRGVEFGTRCPKGHSESLSYTLGDILFRLHTLSFWCLQCGRAWPATDDQRSQLLERLTQAIPPGTGTQSRGPHNRQCG
jgi:hypothetical protein